MDEIESSDPDPFQNVGSLHLVGFRAITPLQKFIDYGIVSIH